MPETSGAKEYVKGSLSALEKANKVHYFLLLTAFLLTLDIALVIFCQKNVLTFRQSFPPAELPVGNVILFLTVFSFLLALFFPMLRLLLGLSVVEVYFKWLYKSNNVPPDKEYKYPSLVMHDAILARDEFDYKRVIEHNESEKQKESTLELAFSVALLLMIDQWLIGTQSVQSISQTVTIYLESINISWLSSMAKLVCLFFIGVVGFLACLSLKPIHDDRMYLPKPSDYEPERPVPEFPAERIISRPLDQDL